jgi:hypothetical protein
MSKSLLVGHRISIEPIYVGGARSYGDSDIVINPAMPKLDGRITSLDEALEAVRAYFAAIPT